MSRFLMDRGIFDNALWADPPTFRLFFFLVGKASYKDDVVVGKVTLKRGQYIRSYRNLQSDLVFFENNAEKVYSTSAIKRSVDKLVKDGRILAEECEHGTLFTVVNYQEYQEFQGNDKGELGTALEQRWNSVGTIRTKLTKLTKGKPPLPPKGGSRQRVTKTIVDENWEPPEKFRDWLQQAHPTVTHQEYLAELAKFKSYGKAHGKKYLDHEAALRNWFDSPYRNNGYTTQARPRGSNIPGNSIVPANERKGGSGKL